MNEKQSKRPTRGKQPKKPPLNLQVTTLWEYPSQHYGTGFQGDPDYKGATPSYIIWNLLKRYTQENNVVIDPMCGSGTTIDVAKDLKRKVHGFDLNPSRRDIKHADARALPLEKESVDFAFIDPPYSKHILYSDDERCIGKLHASGESYYTSMRQVISELHRVLKPGRHMGLYVSDSHEKKKGFFPIGFELFAILREFFEPIDIISVVRHNKTLEMGNYRKAADEGNFYLRGFNYLFIMRKAEKIKQQKERQKKKVKQPAKKKVLKGFALRQNRTIKDQASFDAALKNAESIAKKKRAAKKKRSSKRSSKS